MILILLQSWRNDRLEIDLSQEHYYKLSLAPHCKCTVNLSYQIGISEMGNQTENN